MYIGHWSKFNISVLFGSFCRMRQCYRKGDLRGEGGGPPTINVIPATSRGCFCTGSCWDLGMFQAIIYISSEHNISKKKKKSIFNRF